MIVDTSAVVAIVLEEPGYEVMLQKLLAARSKGIGTPTLLEACLVLAPRMRPGSVQVLDGFLRRLHVEPIAFTESHWRAAAEASLRFGKGRHPAALNFGDCLTYAVAKVAGMPLLFIGRDFAQTDLTPA